MCNIVLVVNFFPSCTCDIVLVVSFSLSCTCSTLLQATSSVNQQHALIEYRTDEDCFILQDLNSGQGSYVNERRVENSYYQLEKGDMLRFGDSSDTYELVVEHDEERVNTVYIYWNMKRGISG